jgi:hypothetical protein
MSDPAIKAASRVFDFMGDAPVFCDDCYDPAVDTSIDAVREALKPLRELVEEWERYIAYGVSLPMTDVVARLKPLIYTTEELS